MGWTVLYIAFGAVALWLLGEVLLQYKARLRWRLVAFSGFLCVVLGVLLSSVPVIAFGALAFGTGQTFVTLSFRRGFSTGWALGGKPGTSRRRRPEGRTGAVHPVPPVAEPADGPPAEDPPTTGLLAYQDDDYDTPRDGYGGQDGYRDDGIGGEAYQGGGYPAEGYDGDSSHGDDGAYRDDEIHQGRPRDQRPQPTAVGYADPYPDPYATTGSYDAYGSPEPYTVPAGTPRADYAEPPYAETGFADGGGTAAWPAAPADGYYQDTPAGGVWVPPPREPATADPAGYGYPPPDQTGHEPYPRQPDGYEDSSGQGYYFTDDQRY